MFFRVASSCVRVTTVFLEELLFGVFAMASYSTGWSTTDSIIFVKLRGHLRLKVGLNLVHFREFSKSTATVATIVVDSGDPVGVHRRFLLFRILASIALDLHNQVRQVLFPLPVLDQPDEIGKIRTRFRTVAVRHFEAEVLILHVRPYPRVRFGHAAELRLPIAVENHPVDVAAPRVGLPASGFGRIELDMVRRAGRVVGVEHCFDGPLSDERSSVPIEPPAQPQPSQSYPVATSMPAGLTLRPLLQREAVRQLSFRCPVSLAFELRKKAAFNQLEQQQIIVEGIKRVLAELPDPPENWQE